MAQLVELRSVRPELGKSAGIALLRAKDVLMTVRGMQAISSARPVKPVLGDEALYANRVALSKEAATIVSSGHCPARAP
jgi:hypothetical protein